MSLVGSEDLSIIDVISDATQGLFSSALHAKIAKKAEPPRLLLHGRSGSERDEAVSIGGLETEALAERVYVVQLLPGEELDFVGDIATAIRREVLRDLARLTAEVSVAGSLTIDRSTELEAPLDSIGAEVKDFVYELSDLCIAEGDVACPIGVDEDADRLSDPDGIGELYEYFVSDASSDEVLRYVASCIGCRAVYLRGVLAREGTTTMGGLTSVGVDDDLTPRETSISVRPPMTNLPVGLTKSFVSLSKARCTSSG